MRLQRKVIIVTGASSGIGEGIAQRFLAEGAFVVGCGVEESARLTHTNFHYKRVDVTDYTQAEELVVFALAQCGKIDGLINCAGITGIGSLESTTPEAFCLQFEVNVMGVFHLCKAAIGELKKQNGASVVNIASDLGIKPIPERVAYCPSKAAVIMLTKQIALEYAPLVRANCILPGLVRTPMVEERFRQAADPDALLREMSSLYPMARIGTIDDMANAAVYLVSDDSSFVTGTEIAVCGGSLL